MTSIEELKKELERQKKKIADAKEIRKLKFQLALAKSPTGRALVSGAKATGKALTVGAKKLQEEGIRRQKIQSQGKKRLKKKGRDVRESINRSVFQPLDF